MTRYSMLRFFWACTMLLVTISSSTLAAIQLSIGTSLTRQLASQYIPVDGFPNGGIGSLPSHPQHQNGALLAAGNWTGSTLRTPASSIKATVTRLADHYHYQYVFEARSAGSNIDHLVIQLGSSATVSDLYNTALIVGSLTAANFGLTVGTHGVNTIGTQPISDLFGALVNLPVNSSGTGLLGKTWTFSFDSVLPPEWGNFYADGHGSMDNRAHNRHFNVDPYDDTWNWKKIPVPGSPGEGVIPEPASVAVWLLLAGVWICCGRFGR